MTIKEIAAEYGISDSTARRKLVHVPAKGIKGKGIEASRDYFVADVRAIFGKKKAAK